MTCVIAGRAIEQIRVVDDDPLVRAAYEYPVEDLGLRPVLADGPFHDLAGFVEETIVTADAAICDYHLRVRNYASFDGAASVAALYQKEFPAVLCTRFVDDAAAIVEMRRHRRYIPVLLNPDDLHDNLVLGLEQCIEEFGGNFSPSRRPWRTLVRVEAVDHERSLFYVVLPGWSPLEVIGLRTDDVAPEIQERLDHQARFHALVNIGAEGNEDLYFDKWEVD